MPNSKPTNRATALPNSTRLNKQPPATPIIIASGAIFIC
jgi:hypothetical protein